MTFCNFSFVTHCPVRHCPSYNVQSCNVQSVNVQSAIVQSVNIQSSIIESCNVQSCNFSVPQFIAAVTERLQTGAISSSQSAFLYELSAWQTIELQAWTDYTETMHVFINFRKLSSLCIRIILNRCLRRYCHLFTNKMCSWHQTCLF